MSQTASVWIVVVVTAERYVALCWPFHASRFNTMKRVRRAAAAVWILSVILYVVVYFQYQIVNLPSCNVLSGEVDVVNHKRISIYLTAVRVVVVFLCPLCLLVFFNLRLVRAIRQSSTLRRQQLHIVINDDNTTSTVALTNSNSNERRSALLLTVVVAVFIVCQLPANVSLIGGYIVVPMFEPSEGLMASVISFEIFSVLLLCVNSSINFFIYFLMGKWFRKILLQYFTCEPHTK